MEAPESILYRRFLLWSMTVFGMLGLALRATALAGMALGAFALLVLSWRGARRRLRALDVRRGLYPSAFEGDTVAVEILLDNRSRRPAHLVEIADAFGPGISDRQVMLEPGPLGAMRRRRLGYRGICSRTWGVYAVGPPVLRASGPLGLYHRRRPVMQVEPFAVFPRVHPVAGLERLGARASLAPQEASAARPGHGADYLGARDYRPGDDPRRIHWPATARRGAPVVKEYEVDLIPYLSLFLDLHRARRAGTGRRSVLEYLVRTTASLLWSAIRRGDMVQVFAEGARPLFVPPARGEMHLIHCLYELIGVRQDGSTGLLDLVDRHRLDLPPGSTAAILSGTISVEDHRLEETLDSLHARGVRPLLVFVNDHSFAPIDRWPLPREQALEHCRELAALMRARGVPGAILSVEDELEETLARPDLFWSGP